MNVASRPSPTGKTRTCPHCKAVILESLSICPGCMHHLRFDSEAAKRQVAATSALKVEAIIRHPPVEEAWEYYVTISIRNDRGEEVDRQVVNVGALQGAEKRTFTLSVEVLPPRVPEEQPSLQPPRVDTPTEGTRCPDVCDDFRQRVKGAESRLSQGAGGRAAVAAGRQRHSPAGRHHPRAARPRTQAQVRIPG